jgi:hypothetical protein
MSLMYQILLRLLCEILHKSVLVHADLDVVVYLHEN